MIHQKFEYINKRRKCIHVKNLIDQQSIKDIGKATFNKAILAVLNIWHAFGDIYVHGMKKSYSENLKSS